MVGNLLLRGMLLGVLAGLLAFGIGRIFGEPWVERAIAFEEPHAHVAAPSPQGHVHDGAPSAAHQHEAAEVEVVSRGTQAGIGLFTGVVVYGAALGGLFSLAFAFAYGRLGRLDARATAGLLALGGFLALVVVPGLKYPANPPAVGQAETIGMRTAAYFLMLLLSLVVAVGATMLARALHSRLGAWGAAVAGGAAFVVVIALAQAALPTVDEVPEAFSASLLWNFRIAWLGMQAVLWATLGLGFGLIAERVLADDPRRPRAVPSAA